MGFIRGLRPLTDAEVERHLEIWKESNAEQLEKMDADEQFDAIQEMRFYYADCLLERWAKEERNEHMDPMKFSGHQLSDFA